jgi:anti-sigma factor RsiW
MKKDLPLSGACKSYEEDLVLYYYGESSAADRGRVDGHLSACAACRRCVDDLRALLPQLTRGQEMPAGFWQSYYRETVAKLGAQDARTDWWSSLFAPWKTWLMPAFGTAAVAVLAIGLLLARGSLPSSIHESAAKLPAEIIADADQLEFFSSLEMLESLSQMEPSENGRGKTKPDQSSPLHRERAVA